MTRKFRLHLAAVFAATMLVPVAVGLAHAADLPYPPAQSYEQRPAPPIAQAPIQQPVQQVAQAPECTDYVVHTPRPVQLHLLVWGRGPLYNMCGLKYLGQCPEDCKNHPWGRPSLVYELTGNVVSVPTQMVDYIKATEICAFGTGIASFKIGSDIWDAVRGGSAMPRIAMQEIPGYQARNKAPRIVGGPQMQGGPVQTGRPFRLSDAIPAVAAMQAARAQAYAPPAYQLQPQFYRPMMRRRHQPSLMPVFRSVMNRFLPQRRPHLVRAPNGRLVWVR
jgi:hypothetical protein